MFKVECQGCRAPYQVDERRIPKSGLKMRCPKCGTRFTVEPPHTHGSAVDGEAAGRAAGARKPKRDSLNHTMIGVSASEMPKPPGRPSVIPMPEPLRNDDLADPGPRKANPRGTLSWVPPAVRPDSPSPDLPERRRPPARRPPAARVADPFEAPLGRGPSAPPSLPDLPALGARSSSSPPGRTRTGGVGSAVDAIDAASRVPRPDATESWSGRLSAESDLPAALGGVADLPAPATPPGAGRAAARDSSLDLPVALGGADLPAILGGPDLLSDLPAVVGDLPVSGGAADLPAALGSLSDERADHILASDLGLPTVGEVAGSPGRSDDTGAAQRSEVELPSVLGGGALPEVTAPGQGRFGQVDLPTLDSREQASERLPSVLGPGALPAVAGAGQVGFGKVDLPAIDPPGREGVAPPAPLGAEAFPVRSSAPVGGQTPPARKRGSPFAEDPAGASEQPFLTLSDMPDPFGEAEGGDPFSDPFGQGESLELDLTAPAEAHATQQPSAPSETDGSLLQRATAQMDPGGAQSDIASGLDSRGVDGSALEVPRARPRRARRWIAPLALGLAVVGGAALALKPDWGPFGVYYGLDQWHRQEHEQQLTLQRREVVAALDGDSFASVKPALENLEVARAAAMRFRPLAAYAVYVHTVAAFRYGPWPEAQAIARTNYERLGPQAQTNHPLAFAAQQAASARLVEAPLLDSLRGRPDGWALLGELLLAAGTPRSAEAVTLWAARVQKQPRSPQANYGLARAQLLAGDHAAAETAARAALEANPKHFGARVALLEAHRKLQKSRETADAGKTGQLVESVSAGLAQAAPSEATRAWSVLGEMHLHYGRASQAQEAFEAALRVRRQAPRALAGLGETLFRAGRYTEALARFEAALRADPASFDAGIGVAQSRVMLEHLPEAKQQLEALNQPNHPKTLYWMARAQHKLGEEDAALSGYRAAIEASRDPEFAIQAYLGLAQVQAGMGDLGDAKETLSLARKKLRPTGALFKAFGKLHLKEGAFAAALKSFDLALPLDRQDTEVGFLRGVTLSRLGRFEEAEAVFTSVESSDKEFPGLAIERGRLFEDSGRLAKALAEFRAALDKSPDSPELKLRLGCAQVAVEATGEAIGFLQQAQAASPRQAEPLYCLARARKQQGNLREASRLLERAIALDSSRSMYFLYLGWVSNEMGRPAKANLALDKAIELDTSLAEAYWQRGVLRRKQGAARDAVADLRHALALKPSLTDAHAELAMAFADLGQTRRAISLFAKALEAQPENATWRFRLGKMLDSHAGFKRSRPLLERAIELTGEQAEAPSYQPPPWLWQAHYLMARGQRRSPRSAPHWEAYLKLTDESSPYRREAQRALKFWNR